MSDVGHVSSEGLQRQGGETTGTFRDMRRIDGGDRASGTPASHDGVQQSDGESGHERPPNGAGKVRAYMDVHTGREYYIDLNSNTGIVRNPDGVERRLHNIEKVGEYYMGAILNTDGTEDLFFAPVDAERFHKMMGHRDWIEGEGGGTSP